MTAPVQAVPVSLICGMLGVGKTTAILDLMARRPAGARWAILVNELGKVGIDGALLEGDYTVRQIAGGCVCCSSGPQLQVHLARLLREERPDRVIVEPTGLALPGAIVDMLRRPGMADAVRVHAVITLVDPRRLQDRRLTELEAWHAQVEAADVLVANHADEATPAQLEAFAAWAAALWPPKAAVGTAAHGRLDMAWLDLEPAPHAGTHHHHHDHAEVASLGWVYPRDVVFDRAAVVAALQAIAHGHPGLPAGLRRLKGVLRTNRGWLVVQGTDERLEFQPTQHRWDSRVELLVPTAPAADGAAVQATLEAARVAR